MAAYRDGRRRKLLREDARADADEATPRTSPLRKRSSKRTYSDEARHAHQPRVTDLIPQRPLTLAFCWLSTLLIPAALAIALFLSIGNAADDLATQSDATFRLAAIGSLSRWWSSVLLLLGAAICGMNYHLRRYKLDDYRARYRVWFVVMVMMIAASADVATNMHASIYQHLTTRWSESRVATVQAWWGPVAIGLGLLGFLRLSIEIWASRGASVVLFLAAASYTMLALVLGSFWQPGDRRWHDLTLFSAVHMGHHLLVFALLLYCRFVYRSAQGSRATETKGTKRRRPTATSSESESDTGARPNRSAINRQTDLDDSYSPKSEVRRQRKEQRRQQRRAA